MKVRIGNITSTPRKISGGSPQGSILGNVLFCMLTDQLNSCAQSVNGIHGAEHATIGFSQNGFDLDASSEQSGADALT